MLRFLTADHSGQGACTDAAAVQRNPAAQPEGLSSSAAMDEAPSSNGGAFASVQRADDDLSTLEALGFSRSRAQVALMRCRNDVERAANLLFSGVT